MTTAGHGMGSFHISNRIVVLCCAGVSAEDYPCIGFAGCVNASTFYDFMVVTIALVVVVVVITRETTPTLCVARYTFFVLSLSRTCRREGGRRLGPQLQPPHQVMVVEIGVVGYVVRCWGTCDVVRKPFSISISR